MDVVPYAFCDAVSAILKDLDALVELTSDDSTCGVWNAAAVATGDGRVAIDVNVDYEDGVWSYQINKLVQNRTISITFQELKAISRRSVRTSSVGIGCSLGNSHISNLDEATQILKYSAPFVNLAEMWIPQDLEIPDDILVNLISPFCNSSFSIIRVFNYSKAAEDFLKIQLQSEGLKRIEIDDEGWSDELRVALFLFQILGGSFWLRTSRNCV